MGVALHSYKLDSDGKIRVRHTFYAPTEVEAEALMAAHAAVCPEYGPAVRKEETIEITMLDVEAPDPDDLDDFDDEPDDEEEDDGEPDEEEED